jgi:hypothetical protein
MHNRILVAGAILAVTGLACGADITLPKAATPGPEIVDHISVPVPETTPARLTVSFGAGELKLAPGAANLVDGTATYNVPDLKPEIVADGAAVEIKQGDLLKVIEPGGIKNEWEFRLGNTPMELTVNAGAYEGEFDLGGIPLTGLTIKDGASTANVSFDEPNPATMAVFRYETGASNVKLSGLANANFSTLVFNSAAGDYTLDFSGILQRDATVTVSTGLSNVILVVPEGVAANVRTEAGLSNVSASPSWAQNGDRYSQEGSGPVLTFIIKTGAGNLTLAN